MANYESLGYRSVAAAGVYQLPSGANSVTISNTDAVNVYYIFCEASAPTPTAANAKSGCLEPGAVQGDLVVTGSNIGVSGSVLLNFYKKFGI